MKKKLLFVKYILMILCIFAIGSKIDAQKTITLDNENFILSIDRATGAISSFLIKKNKCDLIAEKKLESNFRICLPLKEYAL